MLKAFALMTCELRMMAKQLLEHVFLLRTEFTTASVDGVVGQIWGTSQHAQFLLHYQ